MPPNMCSPATAPSCKQEPAAGASQSTANGVRVFLVEGDSYCRATLAAMLMKQGFDVQSFEENAALREALANDRQVRHRLAPAGEVACGKLVLDQSKRRAWWGGSVVPLSVGEFEIVLLLAANAGHCAGYRAIYDCLHYEGFVAGSGDRGFYVNVRSAIRRIRKKFRAIDSDFAEIQNSRAFGYCWARGDERALP